MSETSGPFAGRTIDRYRIVRAIREGGVGAVYLAEDTSLARPVALKFLKADQAADQALVQRLHQEAKTMARVENPHIVSVYDFVASPEHVYVAMQYIDGESLMDRLERKGQLPVAEVLRVVRDCARGLASAHAQDILHRDMKPSNVILTRRGEVKVADFGLAQQTEEDAGRSRKVEGTPHYMSPEQCRGIPQCARSDVYSLGVMTYQLLTGVVPFDGTSIRDVLTQHVKAPVPDLRERFPELEIPPALTELIGRMMAKDPSDRPDAAELVQCVTDIAQGAADGGGRRARAPRRSGARRVHRGGVITALVSLLLGCGAVAFGFWYIQNREAERAERSWESVAGFEGEARIIGLESFLREFPESVHVADASRLLAETRAAAEIAAAETAAPPPPSVSPEELDQARRSATLAYENARRAGAENNLRSEYRAAVEALEDAQEHEENGDIEAALAGYRATVAAFTEVQAVASRAQQEREAVDAVAAEVGILRAEAQRLFLAELDAEGFSRAQAADAEARAALESGDLAGARSAYESARDELSAALEQHGAAGRQRFAAEKSRADLTARRAAAVDAGAEEHAAERLANGDEERGAADQLLADGRYDEARQRFEAAAGAYDAARQAAEVAAALAGNGNGGASGAPGEGPGDAPPENGGVPGADGGAEAVNVARSVTARLADILAVEPRGADGLVSLAYPSGAEFGQDVTILKGRENVHFEESRFPTGSSTFTFTGEKSGFLLLDVQFVDQVEVDLKARFFYVLPGSPFFRVVIMSEDDNSFYASDFGSNVGVFTEGRRRSLKKSRHKSQWASPTKWVQKGRDIRIAMSYEKDGDDGVVRVTHRFSECAALKTDRYQRGRIGFWWSDVVFAVKDLEVKGRVDEEWLKLRVDGGR